MFLSHVKKLSLLVLGCFLFGPTQADEGTTPNIFIISWDDVSDYRAYDNGGISPNLDAIIADGMKFTNCSAASTCSPSRGQLQTGRHASGQDQPGTFDDGTGLGRATSKDSSELDYLYDLKREETTISEMLDIGTNGAYQKAIFGKYHLAARGDLMHPLDQGYDHAYVTERNIDEELGEDYFNFEINDNGTLTQVVNEYCTTHFVDKALDWVQAQPTTQPLFVQIHTLVTHAPLHHPPEELIPLSLPNFPPGADPNHKDYRVIAHKAAFEAIDTEVTGRFLSTLRASGHLTDDTIVIFIGDNGCFNRVREKDLVPAKASKMTNNSGAVLVPMVFSGGCVTDKGSICDAMVSMTDIYATVADVTGVDLAQISGPLRDTQSMLPLLSDSTLEHRDVLYNDRFTVNHENTGHPSAFDGSFADHGYGSGETLTLTVHSENGCLLAGDTATIEVTNAKPNKVVRLYIGFTNAGNNGWAYKDIIISVYPWEVFDKTYRADANGNLTITNYPLPIAPPGTEIFVQAVVRWSKNDWEASTVVGSKFNAEENTKRFQNDSYTYIFRPLHPNTSKPVEAFYDFKNDRYEWTNLIENGEGGLNQEQQDNLNSLRDQMNLRWPGMRP